jgi:tripartite-type tricarboxylate transporter receptor subunit TctC
MRGSTCSARYAVVDLAPLLESNRARALSVTDEPRHSSFPSVPTFAEADLIARPCRLEG